MVGISIANADPHFSTIPFAVYQNGTQLEIYESGVQSGSMGLFTTGDVVKIEISEGDVIYSVNDVVKRTVLAAVPLDGFSYNVDVAVESVGTRVENVQLTLPTPENPLVTEYEGFDPDNLDKVYGDDDTVTIRFHQATDMAGGNTVDVLTAGQVNALFTFSPAPGTDYQGSWHSAKSFVVSITTASGTAPAFNTATVSPSATILNAKNNALGADPTAMTLSGHWGADTVLWVNDAKLIVDGNELLRPAVEGESWNAGAASSRSFTGDGYVETIATGLGSNRMIGFSAVDASQHFADMDFAFYLHLSSALEAYELGVQRGLLGNYKAGDVLRLERSGTDITYSINGLIRRTVSGVDPTIALKVDTSLYSRNAVINNTTLVLPVGGARSTSKEAIRDAVSIHLDSGWNLIGIPLDLDDKDPSVLSSFVNDANGEASSLEGGQGYWVFNNEGPRSVVLTGLLPAQPAAAAGWSLYAPVANSAAPAGAIVWSYANGTWRLVEANEGLRAGVGYRVYSE